MNVIQHQPLVDPLVIIHLHTLFDVGIVAVPDVLLLDLNDWAAALVGTGPTKESDRGLDMIMVKDRSFLSATVYNPSGKFRYSTNI